MAITKKATQISPRTRRLRPTTVINWHELITRELAAVPQRILVETGGVLKLKFAERVPTFIWHEAGADHTHKHAVQQAIEQHLINPLLRLSRTGQLSAGKTLVVEVDEPGKKLLFDCHRVPRAPRAMLL